MTDACSDLENEQTARVKNEIDWWDKNNDILVGTYLKMMRHKHVPSGNCCDWHKTLAP